MNLGRRKIDLDDITSKALDVKFKESGETTASITDLKNPTMVKIRARLLAADREKLIGGTVPTLQLL